MATATSSPDTRPSTLPRFTNVWSAGWLNSAGRAGSFDGTDDTNNLWARSLPGTQSTAKA